MSVFADPEDRWEPWHPDVVLSGGPERIYDRDPVPDDHRPAGFVRQPREVAVSRPRGGRAGANATDVIPGRQIAVCAMPLLWEGDQA